MKRIAFVLIFIPLLAFAGPMYSPTWGFFIDLPEGYEFIDGDGKDRFSFNGPQGLMFDIVVYNGRFNSMLELVNDVNAKLSNKGDVDFFEYAGRLASVITLSFGEFSGWGLAVELNSNTDTKPIMLALAYYPAANARGGELDLFCLSALDSICPSEGARRYPGPIMEYSYPRGEAKKTPLVISGLTAMIHENDAEASQVLIEREFAIFNSYLNTPFLQDACIRYYRFIYRDSYSRISDAVSAIARNFAVGASGAKMTDDQKRLFAQKTLTFVQGFSYERDLSGSDFLNLVTAITQGRGDCDSRAMLFALILAKADIGSALMLSHHYSHAMGLANVTGNGARFEALGTKWLVAETTAKIDIGLIDQELSDTSRWYAVVFEE